MTRLQTRVPGSGQPRARVLLAWELGASYGHIVPLQMIAQALRRQGHECVFALRTLRPAQELLTPDLGPVVQAPLGDSRAVRSVRVQLSYASLLHNVGAGDPVQLAARLRAWKHLMGEWRVDAVVADHAPFALLAARALDLPRAACGPGFSCPPVLQPFPAFTPDRDQPDVIARNERLVLGEMNTGLQSAGLPPLDHLAQLFDGADCLLFTYPELDPYSAHRSPAYLGVADQARGAEPAWPPGDQPRVFAYLRSDNTLRPWLQALSQLPVRALVRVTGTAVPKSVHPRIRLVSEPVHTRKAMESCDLAISYAPHGTVAEALLAGMPQVLLANQVEQVMTAYAAQSLGAAILPAAPTPEALAQAIRRALDDATLRAAAQDFAQRYSHQDRSRIVPDAVAALCTRWWR